MSNKNIWIDNLLLFKIRVLYIYPRQYLCECSEEYKNELNMEIGDIIFMQDRIYPRKYKRLGKILAFNERKIIVGFMSDIGIGSKLKMEQLHNESLNEEEVENDGTLY